MRGITNIKMLKKELGYVTDGLILHLDGIEYGNQSGKWIDLVNGTEFIASGNVSKVANGFSIAGGTINSSTKYNIVYVEFVMKHSGRAEKYIITPDINTKTIVIFNNNMQIPARNINGFSYSFPYDTLRAFGTDYSKLYMNGKKVTTNSPLNNRDMTYNGFRIGSANFTGEIYSVRVYSRTLTDEEIAQNFAVDKARFGI